MKKNSLKTAFAALALTAATVTASSVTAFAAANNGLDDATIAASEVKPVITVSKEVISLDEAKTNKARTVTLTLSGGTDSKWASSGLHIYFDSRLELKKTKSGLPAITQGEATEELSVIPKDDPTASEQNMKGFFVSTAGTGDYGYDGLMYSFTLTLPDDVAAGDVFPVDIIYKSNDNAEDMFLDAQRTRPEMQAYLFTKGIYNAETNPLTVPAADVAKVSALANIDKSYDGYIAVEGSVPTTTTTAPPTTTTTAPPTTTSTAAPTTTTTAPPTTTATVAPTTTSTAKVSTTTSKSTAKATTKATTKAAASGNSPKTGVAGVGVAAAGLAVAFGTAFVLRKKED